MNRTHALSCSMIASGLLATSTLAQTYVPLPFEDNFANGVQVNSDTITNFWNSFSSSRGNLTEENGNWIFIAGPHGTTTGVPLTGFPSVSALSRTSGEQKYFNLFDVDFGLRVRGIHIEFLAGNGPGTGTVRTAEAGRARFGLTRGSSTTSAAEAIALMFTGRGRILIGSKLGAISGDPESIASTRALDFTLPGNAPATGFDFWLDEPVDGVYSRFNLRVYYGENETYVTNVAFKTAFTAADWGGGDGKAHLQLGAQRLSVTDPQDSIRVTIGSVAITPILPPGLYLIGHAPLRPDFKAVLRPKTELN